MEEIILKVKIIPKSARNEIVGELSDGTLKIRITAPPEKGKANKELKKVLASQYSISKNNITIVYGLSSPHKIIKIRK